MMSRQGDPRQRGGLLLELAISMTILTIGILGFVNFFAATRGRATLRLREGRYRAEDAVSHKPVPLRQERGGYSFPIDLRPFGAQVVRVCCAGGPLVLDGRAGPPK